MAPLPVIADTFRVALHWIHPEGGHAVSVIHMRAPSMTADDVWTAFDAHVAKEMWNAVSNLATIDVVRITPLDGTSVTLEHHPPAAAKYTGNSTGEAIPQMAAIIKFLTALRGRSHRGRIFLPFVAESGQNTGTLDDGQVAAMQSGWVTFRAAMALEGITLVVASYKLVSATDVDISIAEQFTGTQRRRMQRLRA